MSQEEVGLLVRSTMEKARAMAPTSPRSPKSPASKQGSPRSPYTSTSQRLSRSPRSGKKLRVSPRNAGVFFESSSSSVSPHRTPKADITEDDRAESTPMRVTSTEERFTAMVTEKNFTVHTEVAGKKNLSETEINDLVRNSIRRARQNAKGKSRQQLETSFQNTVMLNEVTSSPVKRFSWSSPEGSLDDDSNSGKPLATSTQVPNTPEDQHTYDPCEISSIDGGGTRIKKKQQSTKRTTNPTQSAGIQVKTVVDEQQVDQDSTPVHTNVADVVSPQSIGSPNKSFRSFFGDKKGKPTDETTDSKAEAAPVDNAKPLGNQNSVPCKGDDAIRQCAPGCSKNEKSDLQIDTTSKRLLQTIPESPQKFVPATQRFPTVSTRQVTPQAAKMVEPPLKTPDASSKAKKGLTLGGKTTDVPILKPSTDSSSSTRSDSSRQSRLDVVITSEDVDDMKKASSDGRVTGPTRLEFTPGERPEEDEQDVSDMADIVQNTMSRARKTAEAAQDSVSNTDLAGDLTSETSSQRDSALDTGNSAVLESGSLHSEETKVASNTFRDKLSAPDLQSERSKRGALSMPPMLEDTEDDSDPPPSPLKPLPVLTPKQESFSAPARSAIAFISSATQPKASLLSTGATPSKTTQPFDEALSDSPKKSLETSERRIYSLFGRTKSKATDAKDAKVTSPSMASNKSGRGSRPLLSVKHSESSEEEFPVAKKVRETLSASLHSNIVGAVAQSASEDSNNEHQRPNSTGWRFRSRTNRKQRRAHSTTNTAISSLSVDTDTVITSELIAGLASRQGETISAEELNKLILTMNRGGTTSLADDETDLPLGSPKEDSGEYNQDREIVTSMYAQFCVDFLDFFKFFDFQKTCDGEDDHDDFHSMTGMDTPMEESDEFDPLREVTEETTTCDTDNDGVNENPRMTFSFSVAEETSSSDSSSTSSEEECSSVADW